MRYLVHIALISTAASIPTESLAGYRLGTPLSAFSKVGFLVHGLSGGETLLEACNSDGKVFLTLADDPWSQGRLAYISLARVDDGRCTGDSGLSIASVATNEGLRLGDAAEKVTTLYGPPTSKRNVEQGVVMRYDQGKTLGRQVSLAITIKQGVVERIALGLEPAKS